MKKNTRIFLRVIAAVVLLLMGISLAMAFWFGDNSDFVAALSAFAGAVFSGFIAILVLIDSNIHSRELQEKSRKQEFCDKIIDLVSQYCVAGMAVQEKHADKRQFEQNAGTIQQIEDIPNQYGDECYSQYFEAEQQLYFQLAMHLKRNSKANVLLQTLDAIHMRIKSKTLTIDEFGMRVGELRILTTEFVENIKNSNEAL